MPPDGVPVEYAVPLAAELGVPELITQVAGDGVPRQAHVDLVSTGKGSMVVVVAMERLPDGSVLLLTENTWRSGREAGADGHRRGSSGRRRP